MMKVLVTVLQVTNMKMVILGGIDGKLVRILETIDIVKRMGKGLRFYGCNQFPTSGLCSTDRANA